MDSEKIASAIKPHINTSGIESLFEDPDFSGSTYYLLGESTHGTHEFYSLRSSLTKELIRRGKIQNLIVEADWPDMYQANLYVRGALSANDADAALSGFERFPSWMWRNEEFADLVEWIKEYNSSCSVEEQVGIYGMDLYSMNDSINEVLKAVRSQYPDLELKARNYYSCFDHNTIDPQEYGRATWLDQAKSCEKEAVGVLRELHKRRLKDLVTAAISEERGFFIEQNARVVAHAEAYYRSMFRPAAISWNLRDRHMFESIEALLDFREQVTGHRGAAIWAHNSHIGNAKATDMGRQGEINIGQLLTDRYGSGVFKLGFTTSGGTVIASRNWGSPGFVRKVRDPISGSLEDILYEIQEDEFLLRTNIAPLRSALLERAIGVIYRPETERWSHYFYATLAEQFDCLYHIQETRSLSPLDPLTDPKFDHEIESYPSGL